MLVDYYLRILHFDRRLPLNVDLGPVHIHLYSRSVFFMWVTVAVLVIAGIAVLISRKRELIQRWTSWLMIAPAVGIPIWLGHGTTAVLAAALAVVAVTEYERLVKLGKVDLGLLLGLAVLYPLAAWLRPSLLSLAPIVVLACALPSVISGDVEHGGRRTTFTAFGSVWICWSLAHLVVLWSEAYLVCFRGGRRRRRRLVWRKRVAPLGLGSPAVIAVESQQDCRRVGRRDSSGHFSCLPCWARFRSVCSSRSRSAVYWATSSNRW